jgi:Berberine and berberine like
MSILRGPHDHHARTSKPDHLAAATERRPDRLRESPGSSQAAKCPPLSTSLKVIDQPVTTAANMPTGSHVCHFSTASGTRPGVAAACVASLKLAQDLRFLVGLARTTSDPRKTPAHQTWSPGSPRTWPTGPLGCAWASSRRGLGRVHQAYPGATWDRLVEVNDRYDPTNQFRHNQNIPPSMPLNNSSPRSHAQGWRNCRLGWPPREGVP